MVKALSKENRAAIGRLLAEGEKQSAARLAFVIRPASDHYHAYRLLDSLAAGTLLALIVWFGRWLHEFPWLLLVQLSAMAVLFMLPIPPNLAVRFAPRKAREHAAARRAHEEFARMSHHGHKDGPAILLFVSVAERYIHILSNRAAREKIPDSAWDRLVADYTRGIRTDGLGKASVAAVQTLTQEALRQFPPQSA